MRLIDMKTFVALVKNRHFGKAASELHTTQPAVSIRLASLEQELGCELIKRKGKSFELTWEGEQVLRTSEVIVDSLHKLSKLLKSRSTTRKSLRIGITELVSPSRLFDTIEILGASLPDMDLDISLRSSNSLAGSIESGEFDVVITLEECEVTNFSKFIYYQSKIVLVRGGGGSRPDIIHPPLKGGALIHPFRDEQVAHKHVGRFFDSFIEDAKIISTNSTSITKHWCLGGHLALISEDLVEGELHAGDLVEVESGVDCPPLAFWFIYNNELNERDAFGGALTLLRG